MRLGVLDVGSNTVHLLVVDAHRGAEPTPQRSTKHELRLAEALDKRGRMTDSGADALVRSINTAQKEAAELDCEDLLAFATSAVREAGNSNHVLARVRDETGVELLVLSGEDEARLTFLAARRWLGWSAGNLICVDIGGGSLELAAGPDEDPAVALSLPLGVGRLTRERFDGDPPSKAAIGTLAEHLAARLAKPGKRLLAGGAPDRVVGTSKTFRTLARLAGAAPSSAGPRVERTLSRTGLSQVTAFVARMASADLAELDGVSPARAHQVLAGALVAAATMDALAVEVVELCPWALREGVILQQLDWLGVG